MTNFKIVPVEPTEEMLRVSCDEEQRPLPMWTRMKAIYTAALAEAPVINIVATKNEQGQIVSVTLQDEDHRILEVIAEADVREEHYPANKWIPTNGEKPDLPVDMLIDIKFASGDVDIIHNADLWRWTHVGADNDITHYRIHQTVPAVQGEPVEQREVSQTTIIDTCEHGHKFAKLGDHPGSSCVHCLRIGLARARDEVKRLREQGGALVEALEELVDLMEDTRQGEYIPDSFTTQPARITLAAYRKGAKS